MQNGVKEYQQENQLKVVVILVIMAQFQEIVFKQVQLELGVRLLVLVMVFDDLFLFIYLVSTLSTINQI